MQGNVKLCGTERHIISSEGRRKVDNQEQGSRTSTTVRPDPKKCSIHTCVRIVFTPDLFI